MLSRTAIATLASLGLSNAQSLRSMQSSIPPELYGRWRGQAFSAAAVPQTSTLSYIEDVACIPNEQMLIVNTVLDIMPSGLNLYGEIDTAPSEDGLTYTAPLLVSATVPLALQYSSYDESTSIAALTVSGSVLGQSGTVSVCAYMQLDGTTVTLVSVFGVHDPSWNNASVQCNPDTYSAFAAENPNWMSQSTCVAEANATDSGFTYAPAAYFTVAGDMSYEGPETGGAAFSGAAELRVAGVACAAAMVLGLLALRRRD